MKFLFDLFPVILFVITYKIYGMFPATAVIIVASLVQVAAYWLKTRRFENMHLITLALVVILGGTTLLLHDKSFFMWKPTAVNWLFAAVFLGSQFIGRKPIIARMMEHAIEAPPPVWARLNLSWVIFFIAMGVANLYVASFYFEAEAALTAAAGAAVDIESCTSLSDTALPLCEAAKSAEANWVNFKLYGMMGLTFLFVIGQGFYLARYMQEPKEEEEIA